ncbi:MAG TPA: hypothetical protein VKE51_34240 [Vicinamibacterales bacterium]|nr:hypothetical protein [Vicinamibacterales bacterium]
MIAAVPTLALPPPSRRHIVVRVLAALLLAAITCVPSMARAHDRLDHQRTPAQQHSRFRWSNSCASVPQKHATVVVALPADYPTHTLVEIAPAFSPAAASTDVPILQALCLQSPSGFRAPPADLR